MNLNTVTLIFFLLAVVVFIQLRNVLGRRTGNERPPFNPYSKPKHKHIETKKRDNLIILPQHKYSVTDVFAEVDTYAPQNSPLNDGLRKILESDPNFSTISFHEGAKSAYEIIMNAFAKGDREILKKLLSDDVYRGFSESLEEREIKGQKVTFSLISIKKSELIDACMHEKKAQITVSFFSEAISATYDKNNSLIEGNPQAIILLKDLWTFARNPREKSPNWKLIATDNDA